MTGPAPLWTLDDVARFLRLESLSIAKLRSRLSDMKRYQGFPGPVMRGTNGGQTLYDPVAIGAWLEGRRGMQPPPKPPSNAPPAAPAVQAAEERDFDLAALSRAVRH